MRPSVRRLIQIGSEVSELDRSEDYSLWPMLPSREFLFSGATSVLGNIPPFLGCSENLAHTTLEVVNGFLYLITRC